MPKRSNWLYYENNNTSTKGPGNLYGNTEGAPTEHINYPYAKKFNEAQLFNHFEKHGAEVEANSMNEYEELALEFANNVDRMTNESFVDINGTTYKYNSITNEFAIINKEGVVITYFKPTQQTKYWYKEMVKHGIF